MDHGLFPVASYVKWWALCSELLDYCLSAREADGSGREELEVVFTFYCCPVICKYSVKESLESKDKSTWIVDT